MKETSTPLATSCGAGIAGTARRRAVSKAGLSSAGAVLALGSAVLLSNPHPVTAQVAANQVWAGCTLNALTVDALIGDMETSGLETDLDAPPEVAFVVIYSLNYDNDGQPVVDDGAFTGDFTGPVICRNPGATIATVDQTDEIPGGGNTIDIFDAEEAFILRYEVNTITFPQPIEKRVCHTVNSETQCFRVHGLPPPPPPIIIE